MSKRVSNKKGTTHSDGGGGARSGRSWLRFRAKREQRKRRAMLRALQPGRGRFNFGNDPGALMMGGGTSR